MEGSATRHVSTLVYARHGAQVVLLERRKEPNRGLWSPPGGKIDVDETPLDNARRELAEETGLQAEDLRLRAVVSEHDVGTDESWLMFVFVAAVEAAALAASSEGEAAWVPLSRVAGLPKPPADPHILEAVLDDRDGVAFLRVRFRDGELEGVEVSWA